MSGFQDSWISGFQSSKMKRCSQKWAKMLRLYYMGFFFFISSKTVLFCKVAHFLCKSSSQKKTSIVESILTWKCFWYCTKVAYFLKFLQQNCSIFNPMHFKLRLAPLGGFTKIPSLNFWFFSFWYHQFLSDILKTSSFVLGKAI